MRIHVASDLHLEFLHKAFPHEHRVGCIAADNADVLVLAGDIHNGAAAVQAFAHWPIPVLLIAGNHEFYGHAVQPAIQKMKAAAQGTSVTVLDCDAWMFRGVRFLGCTLWTDYALRGDEVSRMRAMVACESMLADHRKIRGVEAEVGRFGATQALQIHQRHRQWLEDRLAEEVDGPTVVVTHHAPHPGSIHPRFQGNPCNAGFISRLDALLEKPSLWIHGHVHDSFDYVVGTCRVVSNPGGYPGGLQRARRYEDIVWENPGFDPYRVLEV